MSIARKLKRVVLLVVAAAALLLLTLMTLYYVPDPGPMAPRVLVSVDRTLWNRVGLNRLTYVRKLRQAGLSPVLVEFPAEGAELLVIPDDVDGLVLTGGGDVAAAAYGGDPGVTRNVKPARDAFEFGLLAIAESRSLPVLGLCRGAQLINVHRGGTLGDFRDEPRFEIHRNAFTGHPVGLEGGSRLARIYGTERIDAVTTWHGQHVDVPGRDVVVTALSPDGVAEGFEVSAYPFMVGVQWHAEMPPWDRLQDELFEAFAAAVNERS